jgi:hypothetical protein
MRRCAVIFWMTLAACRTAAPAPERDWGQLEIDEAEGSLAQLRLTLRLVPVPLEPAPPARRAAHALSLQLSAQPARSDDAVVVARVEADSPRYGQCHELWASAAGVKVRLAQPLYSVQAQRSGLAAEELRSAASFEAVERLASAPEVAVSLCADTFRASDGQRQTLQRFFKEWSARRR